MELGLSPGSNPWHMTLSAWRVHAAVLSWGMLGRHWLFYFMQRYMCGVYLCAHGDERGMASVFLNKIK